MKLSEPIDSANEIANHRSFAYGDRYRVVLSCIQYGAGALDRWYALVTTPRERILGDFGSQAKATRACREHAERSSSLFGGR